jgi:hypothetical protein
MLSKKAEKLARYYDICGCGDPVAPTVMGEDTSMLAATLPPAPEPDLAITDANEMLNAGEALLMVARLKPCSKFDKGSDVKLMRFLLRCFFGMIGAQR